MCDVDDALASAWSKEREVPWYHRLSGSLDSKDCDFVILATPHGLHCQMVCDGMEAGMPVLIQRPMCITVAEADRSHFRHKPVKIPVPRGEYAELHQGLTAGKHDLHWS